MDLSTKLTITALMAAVLMAVVWAVPVVGRRKTGRRRILTCSARLACVKGRNYGNARAQDVLGLADVLDWLSFAVHRRPSQIRPSCHSPRGNQCPRPPSGKRPGATGDRRSSLPLG